MLFQLGELFSGPGGLAVGALNASIANPLFRIEHAWSNDIDPDTCNTYRTNICPDNPKSVICEDVHNLDITKLPNINAFAFGFPCNDFSVVGEQKGFNGKYGPLYTYGVQVLKYFKPYWFLAENVSGLRSANSGIAFKKILKDFRSAGYRIYPHLYKFEEYGVPQTRHRIIIVGIRDDQPYEFRIPSTKPYEGMDVSAKTALENPLIAHNAYNNERPNISERVQRRLEYIKPGMNAFNSKMPEDLKLHVKGATLSQIYRRLRPDKPSYTVTGSGGGGTHIYHYSEARSLTNRERARLQTFPDEYCFKGTREKVRRQIGMAVPCRGAQIIFEAILKTFAEESYDFDDFSVDEKKIVEQLNAKLCFA